MTKSLKSKTAKFMYVDGTTKSGKEKYAYNSLTNIAENISDEVIYNIMPLLTPIQKVESTQVLISLANILQ